VFLHGIISIFIGFVF